MRISMGIGHEPDLQRLVIASVVLHFILMAFLFIPFKTGEREFKSYYVSLVSESAKVSVSGGAPAVRKTEEKPTVKKEASKAEKKRADDKEIKDAKEKMFLKTEKKRKADEDKKKEIDRLAAINAIQNKTRKIEIGKNEAPAKGAGGAPGKGAQMASDSYSALITGKIRNEWKIPPDLDPSGLEVKISIKIDSKGNVVFKKIDTPSGNKFFDDSALKAISKASPLPPPLTEMEIGMRFYP